MLALLLTVLLCRASAVWAVVADEYALKAAFIYNFSLFARWPEGQGGPLRLCFYGKHPFGPVLQTLADKVVNDVPLVLAFPQTVEQAKDCRMLYYDPTTTAAVSQLLETLRPLPVLTISDHALAWSQGAMIVLAVEPNRVVFDIDLTRARAAGLYLSANLLRLARTVR